MTIHIRRACRAWGGLWGQGSVLCLFLRDEAQETPWPLLRRDEEPSLSWSNVTCRKLSPRTLEPLVASHCMSPCEHQHDRVAASLLSWPPVLQGDNPKSLCMPSPAEPGAQYGKTKCHLLHLNLTGLSRVVHMLCRAPPARRGAERKDEDGARLSLSSSQLLLSSLTSWWPKTSTATVERLLGSIETAKATMGTNVSSSAAAHYPSGIYTWVSYRDTDKLVGTNIFLFFLLHAFIFFFSECMFDSFFHFPCKKNEKLSFQEKCSFVYVCSLIFLHTHIHTGEFGFEGTKLWVRTDKSLYIHVCMPFHV